MLFKRQNIIHAHDLYQASFYKHSGTQTLNSSFLPPEELLPFEFNKGNYEIKMVQNRDNKDQ